MPEVICDTRHRIAASYPIRIPDCPLGSGDDHVRLVSGHLHRHPSAPSPASSADPSGAVLSGASVTATSLSTGAERATTTNAQGFFTIPSLKPGEYMLTVKNQGFADFVAPRVVVEVGQTARVDVAMKIEALAENVRSRRAVWRSIRRRRASAAS